MKIIINIMIIIYIYKLINKRSIEFNTKEILFFFLRYSSNEINKYLNQNLSNVIKIKVVFIVIKKNQ